MLLYIDKSKKYIHKFQQTLRVLNNVYNFATEHKMVF